MGFCNYQINLGVFQVKPARINVFTSLSSIVGQVLFSFTYGRVGCIPGVNFFQLSFNEGNKEIKNLAYFEY